MTSIAQRINNLAVNVFSGRRLNGSALALAAVAAVTLLPAAAEACGGRGYGGGYRSVQRTQYQQSAIARPTKEAAARPSIDTRAVAKATEKANDAVATTTVETQITKTAEAAPAPKKDEAANSKPATKTAAAAEPTCKRFVPSAGVTITVACGS
jgi:septal ring-binding cell division protein DamX